MLASHELSLVVARGHSEPAGQIAAREMEVVRIRGALHRAEQLSDDVAPAVEGLFELPVAVCRVFSRVEPSAILRTDICSSATMPRRFQLLPSTRFPFLVLPGTLTICSQE